MVNSAVPFALFAWAAQRAPAGIGAITNAMAVMFTAFEAFAFYGERIDSQRTIGLLAGFGGVVVLASGKTDGTSVASAALAGTFAAFLYGIGANLIRSRLAGLPPGAVAAATLICASVLFAPVALVQWPTSPIAVRPWLCAVLLGGLCTGTAYFPYPFVRRDLGLARAGGAAYVKHGDGRRLNSRGSCAQSEKIIVPPAGCYPRPGLAKQTAFSRPVALILDDMFGR